MGKMSKLNKMNHIPHNGKGQPSVLGQKQIAAQITITAYKNAPVQVNGPINNPILMADIMGSALRVLADHWLKNSSKDTQGPEPSRIYTPSGSLYLPGRG